MGATAKAQVGLDDILSVTSSAEAAAACGDSRTITPISPKSINSSSSQLSTHATAKTSTSKSSQITCSMHNKARINGDEKIAHSEYDKELEPIKYPLGAKSASPSPSARSPSPQPATSQCTSPKPIDKKETTSRPKSLFSSARKSFRKSKTQKQYTIANMYPTPMFKSMDIDSPDGSFSSMGFVGSALGVNMPFASQSSLNKASARRARMAHNRTKSVMCRPIESDGGGMYHSSGRLFRTGSTRTSAMTSYDNLAAANSGGSLYSPSAGLLGENNLQYGVLGGSVGTNGLDNHQHHSVPGSTNILPQGSSQEGSGSPSPRVLARSPLRARARGISRQVTLNPSYISSDNYERRSPTSRLPNSLSKIPSPHHQDSFSSETKLQRTKSIIKQRSLPVNEEPLPPSTVFKDDQGFLKPINAACPPSGFVAQGSIDSHRSSISSSGNVSIPGMPPCPSPGSPNSRPSGIPRQFSAGRSPRSPNMSRQISKISDQISMIDEEAEDAIEAAASAVSFAETQTMDNERNTNGYDKILPTSQRITPSFKQLSTMRSMDNYRSFGAGGYFNSTSSRQGSLCARQSPGLKRQVTICEDSMSIPESGKNLTLISE